MTKFETKVVIEGDYDLQLSTGEEIREAFRRQLHVQVHTRFHSYPVGLCFNLLNFQLQTEIRSQDMECT